MCNSSSKGRLLIKKRGGARIGKLLILVMLFHISQIEGSKSFFSVSFVTTKFVVWSALPVFKVVFSKREHSWQKI